MSLNTAQIAALKTELQTDPKALGYSSLLTIGDQQAVADLLNDIHTSGDYDVNNEPVEPSKLVAQITTVDLVAMNSTQTARLQLLFTLPRLDLANSVVYANLATCFPAAGETLTNLTLLQKRHGTRGEVLFGNSIRITSSDVANAVNS